MKKEELQFIQEQIGYTFNNVDLLQQAFVRRSYSKEHGGDDNEVLEFIGDKVLDFVVVKMLITNNSNSGELYTKFDPKFKTSLDYWEYEFGRKKMSDEDIFICDYTEAKLTEMKKALVQKKTLASRIDQLRIAEYLLMGNGDIQQNINEESSVKEDLFEAILGAIAIDSNWNMEKMENAVGVMLAPETILDDEKKDYYSLIQEWSYNRIDGEPLFRFEEKGYCSYSLFDVFSQKPLSLDDKEIYRTKFSCYLKIEENLPIFRGYGKNQSEARKNVCKVAYDYLCKEGMWLSIRDEIENPNKDDAINQLEILARRGYFSVPSYKFEETYDKNGNPIWESTCLIKEENKKISAKASSKKEAKKMSAYEMLLYVLND